MLFGRRCGPDLEAFDLGPDGCADREEQWQQSTAVIVPGLIEIRVEKLDRALLQVTMAEIHQEEGQIVEDIDRGQRLVELEAIEEHRVPVLEEDVAKMKIPMAPPDEAGFRALVQAISMPCQFCSRGFGQPGDVVGSTEIAFKRSQVIGIAVDNCRHGVVAAGRPYFGAPMQIGDNGGERDHHRAIELALFGQMVEQRVLIEALHVQQPFDGPAIAVERQTPVILAGDRHQPSVEVRCGSEVELVFGLQGRLPLGERREIKKAVANRTLELVGTVAREENNRRMGFDALDPLIRQTEGIALAQEGDNLLLVGRCCHLHV